MIEQGPSRGLAGSAQSRRGPRWLRPARRPPRERAHARSVGDVAELPELFTALPIDLARQWRGPGRHVIDADTDVRIGSTVIHPPTALLQGNGERPGGIEGFTEVNDARPVRATRESLERQFDTRRQQVIEMKRKGAFRRYVERNVSVLIEYHAMVEVD